MLLISTQDAALAIGAKCGGSAPSAEDASLLEILNFITVRVEDALDVHSLAREENTDSFWLTRPRYTLSGQEEQKMSLRLTNGFVVPNTLEVLNPEGELVDLLTYGDIDLEKGVVNLTSWVRGFHKVRYTSGFAPEAAPTTPPEDYDPDQRVLQGVPKWIKAIAVAALVLWYRTVFLAPKVNKDISYLALTESLKREIATRVYGHYMRPRMGMVFGERR